MHGRVMNLCLYVFQRNITYAFLLRFHPVILQSYLCTDREHMTVKAHILVIIKSWWDSFAENNSLIITMSKVTILSLMILWEKLQWFILQKYIECFQEFHISIFKERFMRKAYTMKKG